MRSLTLGRPVKIAVALALLTVLYYQADWRQVGLALMNLDRWYLLAAICLFVPQTLISAWRWQRWLAPHCRLTLVEATRQTLIGSAWNLIVPSKLGDISKVALLPADVRRHGVRLVVVEKLADLVALATWWAIGMLFPSDQLLWLLIGAIGVICMLGSSTERKDGQAGWRWPVFGASSLLLWWLHLAQIHWFLLAAGVPVTMPTSIARVPVAIFAGLLPVSFCGVGTRDSALAWLFADQASTATIAAVGLLTALRYLVPGVAGIVVISASNQDANSQLAPTIDAEVVLSRPGFQLQQVLEKLRLYRRQAMPIMHDVNGLNPTPAGDD